MEVISFSDFQKQIQELGLKNPKIKFDYYSVKIISLPFFDDVFGQLFLLAGCFSFLFDSSLIIVCLLLFGASLYIFYINFIGLGICEIDFISKTLIFKNRIFIFNVIRKIFRFKTEIHFPDIKQIVYKEGSILNRAPGTNYKARYHLLVETYNDPPLIISQFKKERDVENLVMLLRKFISQKEKIIT